MHSLRDGKGCMYAAGGVYHMLRSKIPRDVKRALLLHLEQIHPFWFVLTPKLRDENMTFLNEEYPTEVGPK